MVGDPRVVPGAGGQPGQGGVGTSEAGGHPGRAGVCGEDGEGMPGTWLSTHTLKADLETLSLKGTRGALQSAGGASRTRDRGLRASPSTSVRDPPPQGAASWAVLQCGPGPGAQGGLAAGRRRRMFAQ